MQKFKSELYLYYIVLILYTAFKSQTSVLKHSQLRFYQGFYETLKSVCLFGLRLYVPVNNFSVMSERSHRFLGITSTFWEVNVSCSRIQHGDLSEDRTPSSRSGGRHSTNRPRRLPKESFVCLERHNCEQSGDS